MSYSLVSIAALLVTLIVHSHLLFDRRYVAHNPKAIRAARFLLWSAVSYFIVDILWGILDQVHPRIYVEIDSALYFAAMGLFLYAWFNFIAKYLNASKKVRVLLSILSNLFFFGGIFLAVSNPFFHFLFTYESDEFVGALGRKIYLLSQAAILGLAALYSFVVVYVRRGEKTTQYLAIALSSVIMVGFTIAQYFNPFFAYYGTGCLILLIILHTFVALQEREDFRISIDKGLAREREAEKQLSIVKAIAYTDSLTGVKSKHSYVEFEQQTDEMIRKKTMQEFSLFLFDLNDLKLINDTYGHEIGDQFIIKSCKTIARFVPNTPIYRYGGDEFVVFLTGNLYKNRYKILDDFNEYIESILGSNEPIIAVGFADFIPEQDNTLGAVFARADETMYHRKKYLKSLTHPKEEKSEETEINTDNMRMALYELFYYNNKLSLVDYLNSSNADEILEVDYNSNSFKQIHHVVGKYFLPGEFSSFNDLVNFGAKHVVHPEDVGEYMKLMKPEGFFERLKNAKIPNFSFAHFRYRLQDGDYRYVEQCVITGKENGFEPGKFRVFLFDVNNMMSRQLGIISDDTNVISLGRDEVTGLLTGKEFLNHAKKKSKEEIDYPWCLVAIDIEHFRLFSEWVGRDKSSVLLASLGAEIVSAEKKYNGIGGYFGQDDFVILMPLDETMISELYNNIKTVINSFDLTGGLLPAIGVAEVEPGLEMMDVFDRASISSSKAKANIDHRICYYSSDMEYEAEQEYRILSSFATALQNDEVTFYLQPQCRISTGAIVGAEALARWIKKEGTIIPPNEFVPVLEKYRFITDLDKYIWEKVCKWISERLSNKLEVVPISINVSRVDIYNLDLATYLRDLCAKYHVPHKYLKVEITESAYATATEKIEQLVENLHKDGFFVMMDDFGSGYSSLNMLSSLKLDALKLDAKFLQLDDKEARKGVTILESVVNMSKMMALPIVVEGVETKDQTEFLAGIGCRYAQGYYFYKPIPIDKFEKVIANKKIIDNRGIIVKINEQFRIREFLDKNIYSDSMLNNIIGSVAIYSLSGEHLDIIRYNEQFYKTVNVPDFVDRLVNIEQFVPEEDRPGLFKALNEAKDNKLSGAIASVRFMRTDGNLSFFKIHFYYLGVREGRDQFYGSAHNVSDLLNVIEQKDLISQYSNDNIIFITKEYDKWRYSVSSHGLANVFGLTSKELEEELNSGAFANRLTNKKELRSLMQEGKIHAEKKEGFSKDLEAYDVSHNKVTISLKFIYVREKTSNIIYLLISDLVE